MKQTCLPLDSKHQVKRRITKFKTIWSKISMLKYAPQKIKNAKRIKRGHGKSCTNLSEPKEKDLFISKFFHSRKRWFRTSSFFPVLIGLRKERFFKCVYFILFYFFLSKMRVSERPRTTVEPEFVRALARRC